jgi:hypothetical protein
MLSRIQLLGFSLIILTLLLFAGSTAAQDLSPHCEAAMDRAAGDYSQCLLRADASYARHENASKLENRQARCETRFDRRTRRAISRHGADACPSSDLVTAMADRTVSYAEGIATEAHGEPALSFLFVQNAEGGTLTESNLLLTGVSLQTGWFTDRPHRDAGQVPTENFIANWGNFFAHDPPNANVTCEVDGTVVNYVVELTNPSFGGVNLSYAVDLIGDESLSGALTCSSDVHVFVSASLQMEASETSEPSEHYDHIWYAACFMGTYPDCLIP